MKIWTFMYIEDGILEEIASFKNKCDLGRWFLNKFSMDENREKILETFDDEEYFNAGNGCEYWYVENELK